MMPMAGSREPSTVTVPPLSPTSKLLRSFVQYVTSMASPSVGSMRTSSPMSRRTMAVWGFSVSGANVFVEDVQLRDSVERFSKLNPAAANAPNDMAPPPMTRMVAMTSNVFLPLDHELLLPARSGWHRCASA